MNMADWKSTLRRARMRRRPEFRKTRLERLEPRCLLAVGPIIQSVDPAANSHSAPLESDISAVFDQSVAPASVSEATFVVNGSQTGTLNDPYDTFRIDGSSVTFDPAGQFKPGELVQATVTTGIQNQDGDASESPFVWQFRAEAIGGSGIFSNSYDTLGGAVRRSEAVALGDLDGDGDLDAFVGNASNAPNSVWLNNGQGRFTDSGQILGSFHTKKVALGDLDGDGDLDAFTANWYAPNRVWINNGQGIFADSGQSLGNFVSEDVSLGDLDGDGDLDAFVVNSGSPDSQDRVWLNDGNAGFSESDQDLGGSPGSSAVVLGDLDGDGDLDALVAGSNTLWLNDGRGRFVKSSHAMPTDSRRMALGDLDGDGDLDVFVGNSSYRDRADKVWRNNGKGRFTDTGQRLGNLRSQGVSLGDVDNDGDLDAFVVGGNKLWINDGAGQFADSIQNPGNGSGMSAALGDLNGDGDLDLFLGEAGPNKIWTNYGSGTFRNSGQSLGEGGSTDVAFGDFDGDGDIDVYVTQENSASNRVWINEGDGGFHDSGQRLGDGESQAVALGDFDGDGDLDAYVANAKSPGGGEDSLWINNGEGDFEDSGLMLGQTDSQDAAAGDVDGDGDLDILVVGNAGGSKSLEPDILWLNDGKGHFTRSSQVFGEGSQHSAVELADLDGDGDLDALIADSSHAAPNTVWLNDGRGHFTPKDQPVGPIEGDDRHEYATWAIALGDVDLDGDLDAFIGNREEDVDTIWLNDGRGAFTRSGQDLGNSETAGALFGDIDGDGDLDLLVTYEWPGGSLVWRNDGHGNFNQTGQKLGDTPSRAAAMGDVDGDGDLDAFIVNKGPDALWLNDDLDEDRYEMNNSLITAHFLDLGNSVSGFQADDDWYQIHVGQDRLLLRAGVAHGEASGDLELQVVDLVGGVFASGTPRTDSVRVQTVLPHGGTWYLKVSGDSVGDPYELSYVARYVQPADANLDGATDLSDFNIWNANKFTGNTDWFTGDFNGDRLTDLSDFNVWSASKFTAAPAPAPVVDKIFQKSTESTEADLSGQLAWLDLFGQDGDRENDTDRRSLGPTTVDLVLASYWLA